MSIKKEGSNNRVNGYEIVPEGIYGLMERYSSVSVLGIYQCANEWDESGKAVWGKIQPKAKHIGKQLESTPGIKDGEIENTALGYTLSGFRHLGGISTTKEETKDAQTYDLSRSNIFEMIEISNKIQVTEYELELIDTEEVDQDSHWREIINEEGINLESLL